MPHTVSWETNGLIRTFTGHISGEEILASNFELHEEPRFLSLNYLINDFTAVTEHSVEINHTAIFAKTDEVVSYSKGKLKIALVVNNTELIELAESYRELMKGLLFDCEIFQTTKDARIWTGN